MQTHEFLRTVWDRWSPGSSGSVILWLRGQGSETIHLSAEELFLEWEDAADTEKLLQYANDRKFHIYTSPGLRKPGLLPTQQGKARDVIALAGFVADIDMAHGVHESDALPETEDDVADILAAAPVPSLIVSTGGGIQAWWLFHQLLPTDEAPLRRTATRAYKAFVGMLHDQAAELGWHLDQTATVQHVFRLPGSQNWKRPHDPQPVEVLEYTGARYSLADLVDAEALEQHEPPPVSSPTSSLPKGSAKGDGLDEVREAMRKLRPDHPNKDLLKKILQGKSCAPPGQRDHALQRACSTIAWLTEARDKNSSELAEIFRPMLRVWSSEKDNPKAKTVEEEIEKVVDKFDRAIEDRRAHEHKQEQDRRAIEGALRRVIQHPDQQSDFDPSRYAVIQYQNSYWIWNCAQQTCSQEHQPIGYYGPYGQTEVLAKLKHFWDGAPEPFTRYYTNAKGQFVQKSLNRIMEDTGYVVSEVQGSLVEQEYALHLDQDLLVMPMCPMRSAAFDPVFDSTIDEWLRVLGGEHAETLLDWIASVPQLERPTSALYLQGPPGVGKTILAELLARFWRKSGPCDYNKLGSFNADMFECPLILIDEGIQDTRRASVVLRNEIAAKAHTWSQKYKPTLQVEGSVRFMIAANNDRVLEQLSLGCSGPHDVSAMAARFLHVQASEEASDWIEEKNAIDRSIIDSWSTEDKFVRHASWLAMTREMPGTRFLVPGSATDMHWNLTLSDPSFRVVIEWICRFVQQPYKVYDMYKPRKEISDALVGNGRVLINPEVFTHYLNIFREIPNPPSLYAITDVLRTISQKRPRIGTRTSRKRYYEIEFEYILRLAERFELDEQTIRENYMREVDFQAMAPMLKIVSDEQ